MYLAEHTHLENHLHLGVFPGKLCLTEQVHGDSDVRFFWPCTFTFFEYSAP